MAHTRKEIVENWLDPEFKFYINHRNFSQREESLLKDNGLKDEYLGACLDYIRWGGGNTVLYEKSTKEMAKFVETWMNLNKENLIWHEDPLPKNFSLPYIKLESCPVHDQAKEIFMTRGGVVKCAYNSCGEVLSDEGIILPLETVFDRINLNNKILEKLVRTKEGINLEIVDNKESVFRMDGWMLAWYAQKWYEQTLGEESLIFN